jgi:hypothetical protein
MYDLEKVRSSNLICFSSVMTITTKLWKGTCTFVSEDHQTKFCQELSHVLGFYGTRKKNASLSQSSRKV